MVFFLGLLCVGRRVGDMSSMFIGIEIKIAAASFAVFRVPWEY